MCLEYECECGNTRLMPRDSDTNWTVCEKCNVVGRWEVPYEEIKRDEQNSIIAVHTMAISSLPPDEFEALELILKNLGETRRVSLPSWK